MTANTAAHTAAHTAVHTAAHTATHTAVHTATHTAVHTATHTAVHTTTHTAVHTATHTTVHTATHTANVNIYLTILFSLTIICNSIYRGHALVINITVVCLFVRVYIQTQSIHLMVTFSCITPL